MARRLFLFAKWSLPCSFSGFIEGLGTIDALHVLQRIVDSSKWSRDIHLLLVALDFEKASSLNDAEISIVEASIAREISPSDAALQAYLAVGRPRLSQIFNALHKAGILSVRKKGRTRLFRISDQAKAHFSDGHMEG